jgi:hypothetical protein
MSRIKLLCVAVWLLGHVPCARADAPPFAPASLAATRGWVAAAAIVDDGQVAVARSSDGGNSWQELPSPRTSMSSRLTLSIDEGGNVEIQGAEEHESWRYRWSNHHWQELGR